MKEYVALHRYDDIYKRGTLEDLGEDFMESTHDYTDFDFYLLEDKKNVFVKTKLSFEEI